MQTLEEITREGEIWKPVVGWEDLYMVSNQARVYSIRNGIELKQFDIHHNVQISKGVQLWRNGKGVNKKIYRLMAEAFIPNPENKPQVDHIDGNHQNNALENLQWATNRENSTKAFGIPVEICSLEGAVLMTAESMAKAAELLQVSPYTISTHAANKKPVKGKYIVRKLTKS